MVDQGIQRYHRSQEAAVQGGRGSETSYAQRLLPELCMDLATAIENAKVMTGPGQRAKYLALLQGIDANQAAFITMKMVFDSLMKGDTINNLALTLGQRIEDQIRFSKFESEYEAYYRKIIEDFRRKNTTSYRHKHRVLLHKQNEKQCTWVAWTPQERMFLGVKLLELCIQSTGLIKKVLCLEGAMVGTRGKRTQKRVLRIEATEDTLEWVQKHVQQAEMLHPDTGPCLVPPNDWKAIWDGGYYTPELRRRVPFVKIKSKAHRKALDGVDLSVCMDAVNALQRTAWKINTRVHDVMKDVWRRNLRVGMPASEPMRVPPCPLPEGLTKDQMTEAQVDQFMQWKREAAKVYGDEKERVSKCIQLTRVLSMSNKYREYGEFWYVYNCDFRGRVYCASPGLSPQGPDFAKGLLTFSGAKELGDTGPFWLAVHGANTFGYDKASYQDREQWVRDNNAAILAVAANPLGSSERSFWSGADKPYQFLAFCFEWEGYIREGASYKCSLPIALDGSCNGLQNFSAMLRDGVGGSATNLCKSTKPEDIYHRVADVVVRKLTARTDCDMAAQWLAFGITRKITKKPVMTLPYGSTRQSCRESVEDHIRDAITAGLYVPWSGRQIFTASLYLSAVIWESIGDVVIAARAAMGWLQDASRDVSKQNMPLVWHTPTGFRVYQGSVKWETEIVRTQLCGRCELGIAVETAQIDLRKQAQGISPNFVHSMDASHLVLTTLRGAELGINDWAMIHDSFGTYACDTEVLHRALREAFVKLYSTNILESFRDEVQARTGVDLPILPGYGELDIEDVLEAEYFFG